MGLIVGEGSFSGDRQRPVLLVGLHERDPQPLQDLQSVFGGTIYGPYRNTTGTMMLRWVLSTWDLYEALPYFDRWLPPSHKRVQYEAWRTKWADYFAMYDRLYRGWRELHEPRNRTFHGEH
jgi:hypothetical protein